VTSLFRDWCAANRVSELPAAPGDVAGFISKYAPLGIEAVWPLVGDISRAHEELGLADPTLGALVSDELNKIAKIEIPRSWPKAEQYRFKALPYGLQEYLGPREAAREEYVNRLKSERDKLKHLLKEAYEKNGTPANEAA
jgi:hypothetical protein